MRTWTLKHEIEYVLRNPDNFENHDVGKLQQRIRTINENLNLITQAADSCARDKSACVLPSGVVLSSGKLPKRKKKSGTPTGPGGPGVTPAILVNGINFVGPRTRKPINFQNLQANN